MGEAKSKLHENLTCKLNEWKDSLTQAQQRKQEIKKMYLECQANSSDIKDDASQMMSRVLNEIIITAIWIKEISMNEKESNTLKIKVEEIRNEITICDRQIELMEKEKSQIEIQLKEKQYEYQRLKRMVAPKCRDEVIHTYLF